MVLFPVCRTAATGIMFGREADRRRGAMRMRGTRWIVLAVMIAAGCFVPAAASERKSVTYGDVRIETLVDGQGPAIVLLPSLARDSEDFGEVAAGLARQGFLVLRPQPRGIGGSIGPLAKVTLHDFARDVAEVIAQLGG